MREHGNTAVHNTPRQSPLSAQLHQRRIYPKVATPDRPRAAAAKAVGSQREVGAAGWQKGTHAFWHGADLVGGGDDGAGTTLQLLSGCARQIYEVVVLQARQPDQA